MIHPQGRARATVRWMPRHRADRTVADLMVRFLLPLIALLLILPTSAQAAFTPAGAIVVNSTADTGKRCDDPTATECTLRGAINQANFNAGPDTITFSLIGPAKFTPATPLPPITQEVTIDGSGGGTVPKVEIDGSLIPEDTRPALAATGALAEPLDKPKAKATRSSDDGVIRFLRPWGLDLRNADSSTIRGLIIHSFPYAQIGMDGTDAANIKGNWLGLKPDGSLSERKSTEDRMLGLSLINSAINVIGGPGADKNVISGNEIGVVADGPGGTEQQPHLRQLHRHDHRRPRPPPQHRDRHPPHRAHDPRRPWHRGEPDPRQRGRRRRDGSYGISVLAAKKTEICSNFVGVSAAGMPGVADGRAARPRHRHLRPRLARHRDRRHRPGRVQHRLRQHARASRSTAARTVSTIAGNRIGTDFYGTTAAPNTNGVAVVADGLGEAPADVTVNRTRSPARPTTACTSRAASKRANAHQQPLRHRRRRRQAAGEQDRLRDRSPRPAAVKPPTDLTFGPGNVVAGNSTDGVQMFDGERPSCAATGSASAPTTKPLGNGSVGLIVQGDGVLVENNTVSANAQGIVVNGLDRRRPRPRQPRRHRAERRAVAHSTSATPARACSCSARADAPSTRVGGSSSDRRQPHLGQRPRRPGPGRRTRARRSARTSSASTPRRTQRDPERRRRLPRRRHGHRRRRRARRRRAATTSPATSTPASASTAPSSP